MVEKQKKIYLTVGVVVLLTAAAGVALFYSIQGQFNSSLRTQAIPQNQQDSVPAHQREDWLAAGACYDRDGCTTNLRRTLCYGPRINIWLGSEQCIQNIRNYQLVEHEGEHQNNCRPGNLHLAYQPCLQALEFAVGNNRHPTFNRPLCANASEMPVFVVPPSLTDESVDRGGAANGQDLCIAYCSAVVGCAPNNVASDRDAQLPTVTDVEL